MTLADLQSRSIVRHFRQMTVSMKRIVSFMSETTVDVPAPDSPNAKILKAYEDMYRSGELRAQKTLLDILLRKFDMLIGKKELPISGDRSLFIHLQEDGFFELMQQGELSRFGYDRCLNVFHEIVVSLDEGITDGSVLAVGKEAPAFISKHLNRINKVLSRYITNLRILDIEYAAPDYPFPEDIFIVWKLVSISDV